MSLEDARRVAVAFDRSRLQTARGLRRISQAKLAKEAGVTPAAISQFENGYARPSASTLLRIAAALQLPSGYFARRVGDPAEVPAAFFRSLRSTSAADRNRATALVGLVHDLVVAVSEHVVLPTTDALVPDRATDLASVERAAGRARERLGLPADEPIADVVRVLERHGIVTARFHVDAEKVDAFSVAYPDRPIVVLGADKGHRDRSRFDASHELAHLILHGPKDVGTRIAEEQAHQFAAAFLMPADAIRDQLPRKADWGQLVELKRTWHVSLAALLKRANTLKVMDEKVMSDQVYVQAMKTMSARGWRRTEPYDLGPPESPFLLAESLRVAEAHGVTLDALADRHGLPVDELRKILSPSLDPRPRVQI